MYLGVETGVNPLMVNFGDPIYLVISRCKHHCDKFQSMLGDLISSLKLQKVNLEHWVEKLLQQHTSLTEQLGTIKSKEFLLDVENQSPREKSREQEAEIQKLQHVKKMEHEQSPGVAFYRHKHIKKSSMDSLPITNMSLIEDQKMEHPHCQQAQR